MNRALIGVPALALAAACIGGVAHALPAGPPRATIAAAQSAPLLPAYGHRYHSRYRRAADPAPAAADSGGVKPGQWEFTTRLDASAPQPPPGSQSSQTQSPQATPLQGGGDATYLSCIQSDRPVPFQFDGAQCKLDRRERQGPRITWSMTCTNPQGAVHSDGTAQYRGDTMDATLINHFPAASGTMTDLTQRITGRYLGPCPQMAQAPVIPPRPNAAPNAPSGSSSQWVEPPATSGGATPSAAQPPTASPRAAPSAAPSAAQPPAAFGAAKPSAASPQNAATAAPAERPPPPRLRNAYHRRHYSRRYYGYGGGAWPGGGGLFGIRIPFLGSL
jgi:uncharacterized protein DUF3617